MKYSKLLKNIFAQRSNNDGQIAVALIAGLAAGAVISILFAPDSGANVRKNIAGQAKGLGNGIQNKYTSLRNRVMGTSTIEESIAQPEVPHFKHKVEKHRKSDIKDIIQDSHVSGQHTEQPIG
jgi:gas vesicle protein